MVGWHHHLNGHEFEQAPGVDEEQGSLVCFYEVAKNQTQLKLLSMHTYISSVQSLSRVRLFATP